MERTGQKRRAIIVHCAGPPFTKTLGGMNQRPIDRKLLASFIEYAANGVVSTNEWHRFIVNHYSDQLMENARSECARILRGRPDPKTVPADDRDLLYRLAKELRNAT